MESRGRLVNGRLDNQKNPPAEAAGGFMFNNGRSCGRGYQTWGFL
jgi:hypothetical protein